MVHLVGWDASLERKLVKAGSNEVHALAFDGQHVAQHRLDRAERHGRDVVIVVIGAPRRVHLIRCADGLALDAKHNFGLCELCPPVSARKLLS